MKLSIVCSFQITIPMCKKKIWVQQENLSKITHYLHVLPKIFLHYTHGAWAGGTFLRQRKKSSSCPRAASVPAHTGLISPSVCLSVCLSVCNEYQNTWIFNIGIKIRVSKWSFLPFVRPLQIPIPMCKKKIRVQQENS
jgi:hypothetical protein